MKKNHIITLLTMLCLLLSLAMPTVVFADEPETSDEVKDTKPVIEIQPEDATRTMNESGVTFHAQATSPDGGYIKYQWYVSEEGTYDDLTPVGQPGWTAFTPAKSYKVQFYCYSAINVSPDGSESEIVYSRLARLEYSHEHAFSEWRVTVEATEEEPGEQVRTCGLCKLEEKEVIPALNGNVETPEADEPEAEEPEVNTPEEPEEEPQVEEEEPQVEEPEEEEPETPKAPKEPMKKTTVALIGLAAGAIAAIILILLRG